MGVDSPVHPLQPQVPDGRIEKRQVVLRLEISRRRLEGPASLAAVLENGLVGNV